MAIYKSEQGEQAVRERYLKFLERWPMPNKQFHDVMGALSLARASFIGVSLGGWLALDYATRRPESVAGLVAMCPGGIGRQKIGIAVKIIPLRLLGRWGKHKAREMVLGRAPAGLSPGAQCFMDFLSLIYENFRPRWVKMPVFSDEYLKRLTMPVLAILGGKDVLLDSPRQNGGLIEQFPTPRSFTIRIWGTSSQGKRRRYWSSCGVRQQPSLRPKQQVWRKIESI